MREFYFIGLGPLESGSWADWFSGVFSAVAVIIAIGGYFLSERNRNREARSRELQIARHLGFKIIRQLNMFHDLYRHVWQVTDKSMVDPKGNVQLWRSISPLVGVDRDQGLELTEPEIELLMKGKASSLLEALSLTFERYRSVVAALVEYKVMYQGLQREAPPPESVDGSRVSRKLTTEDMMRLSHFFIQLDDLIRSMRQMTKEGVEDGLRNLELYHGLAHELFKKRLLEVEHDSAVGHLGQLGIEIPKA